MELPVTVARVEPEREHEHVLAVRAYTDGCAFTEPCDFYLARACGLIRIAGGTSAAA
jgi:hypothetical protein